MEVTMDQQKAADHDARVQSAHRSIKEARDMLVFALSLVEAAAREIEEADIAQAIPPPEE